MLHRLFAASAAFFLLAASPATRAADLGTVLDQALEGSKTPALAVLVMRDGKVVDEAVRGVRRNDGKDPARIDDVWATGSDGKPMTAALIARLVDRGALSWDAPLAKMLPELAGTMRPEYREVTLVQLLSHRAGLPQDGSDLAFFATFFTDKRPLPKQRLAYLAKALAEAPAVAPGTAFNYSNTGYLTAAAIAERATGTPYETLMKRELFGPLGMASARFAAARDGEPRGHRGGKPVTAAYQTADDGNPLMFAPAGGELRLTLRDWARFCLDQLAGAKGQGKLLSAEGYRMMQTAQADSESAVGWGIRDAGPRGKVITHAGSDGNWFAYVALFPGYDSGVILAANAGSEMEGDAVAQAAYMALKAELTPAQ